jgi:uncharacterized membrane protein YkgB
MSYDERLSRWMQRHGHLLLRLGLGLVFVWFGAPKLFPGASPAEDLVAATVPWCDRSWFVPLLGVGEILIGVCLWVRRWVRLGLVLMAGHMLGAALPLFTLPEIAWKTFPIATLEGQYILKNVVLVAGAMVVGGAAATRSRVRLRTSRDTIRFRGDSLTGRDEAQGRRRFRSPLLKAS